MRRAVSPATGLGAAGATAGIFGVGAGMAAFGAAVGLSTLGAGAGVALSAPLRCFCRTVSGVRVKRTLADRENIRFEMGAVGSVSGSSVIGARAGARIPPLGVVEAGASMERRVETGS
ncbi:MAG: hypothetical protein M3036_11440 [Bifidobacteriales bacterium]|nr:hypothetical protein [Bifidobacteriales bacterium]